MIYLKIYVFFVYIKVSMHKVKENVNYLYIKKYKIRKTLKNTK